MDVSRIREDFPVLQQEIRGKPVVYLDSACMSLKPRQVVEAANEYYEKFPGCAGRSSHRFSREVTRKVEEARQAAARFFGAKHTEEMVFTRNTTEAINLVANSLGLKKGDMVITSDREHNSNLVPWQMLSSRKGVEHKVAGSTQGEVFDMAGFESMLCGHVKLVSMVHTSNLDGYTLPVRDIIKAAHDYDTLVMLDGAQSAPHHSVNVRKLDADFFCCSGHKMLGPTGVGMLYGKRHLLEGLEPFMGGGETVEDSTYKGHKLLKPPERFEAGLQNYSGIIGMKAALDYLKKAGTERIARHELELGRMMSDGASGIPNLETVGVDNYALRGGVFNFNIRGLGFHEVALMLDQTANVMVRSGRHCVHSWYNDRKVPGSVRASAYLYNNREDIRTFLDSLKKIAKLGK